MVQTSVDLLSFSRDGVEIRKSVLNPQMIESVKADINLDSAKLKTYGVRNLEKKFESIASLATNSNILELAKYFLGEEAKLVRALFFDKTPDKNWFVTWHQDKTVALNKRANLSGWGSWSLKDGVHHAQVPVVVLNIMVTFRLHIDPAGENNGCLKVIPGSHRDGVLKPKEVEQWVQSGQSVACVVEAGDAVIMRPHVLHASSKARRPAHRRVVHLEYSSFHLPPGIAWA